MSIVYKPDIASRGKWKLKCFCNKTGFLGDISTTQIISAGLRRLVLKIKRICYHLLNQKDHKPVLKLIQCENMEPIVAYLGPTASFSLKLKWHQVFIMHNVGVTWERQ